MQNTHPLHEKAVALSKRYLATEAELLVVIQAIDRERVFQRLGSSSLHAYVVGALKLSDSTAYNFISVARKSVAVPELKAASRFSTEQNKLPAPKETEVYRPHFSHGERKLSLVILRLGIETG